MPPVSAFSVLKYSFLISALIGGIIIGVNLLRHKKLGFGSKGVLVAIALGVLLLLDIYVIEPNLIEVHRLRIQDRKLGPILQGIKVVHITDIHLTDGIGFRENDMIRKVNALDPDLVLFTGDLIDDLSQIPHAHEIFKRLKAKIGIFTVPGNTDHIVMDSQTFKKEFETSFNRVLVNEAEKIRLPNHKVLWLVGVDDPKYRYADINEALANVPSDVPKLVLAHAPGIFEKAVEHKINLVLVGDTHGGQVGIPFLIRLSPYANRTPYMTGIFKRGRTIMYVNRGIGMKTLPIRFLCRPEITVIEIEP